MKLTTIMYLHKIFHLEKIAVHLVGRQRVYTENLLE